MCGSIQFHMLHLLLAKKAPESTKCFFFLHFKKSRYILFDFIVSGEQKCAKIKTATKRKRKRFKYIRNTCVAKLWPKRNANIK